MNKNNTDENLLNLDIDEALKKKRKVVSHCINLECQKEQLLILIDKLYNISSKRMTLLPEEQDQNILSKCLTNTGSYLFSIGDQLKQAQKSKKSIEEEISEAKNQIKSLNSIIRK